MATTWSCLRTLLSKGAKSGISKAFLKQWTKLPYMEVHPEVMEALSSNKPVVALETTIVTHGMPYPINIQTARSVEDTVRSHDVVPATIGVLEGKIHVGLTSSQLDQLADPHKSKLKISRRDLPVALSQGLCGGTTVSATMIAADAVGIPLFVTGGVGGVHRGGQDTLDISADLTELSKTPVGVVSAGVKSILDIPRTLEVLETLGVTVVTYGSSKEFPAFFTAKSGCYVEYNMENPSECARLLDANLKYGQGQGILIAVPLPEGVANTGGQVEDAIQLALTEAQERDIKGKSVTPFVLERVNELTEGQSLETNITLIQHNAHIGSLIALELVALHHNDVMPSALNRQTFSTTSTSRRPIVVGASIYDFIAKAHRTPIINEGTNLGTLQTSFGGVARNIAECLSRLDYDPLLISVVGKDFNGQLLLQHMKELDMNQDGIQVVSDTATSTYCAILESTGELHCAIGDMKANDMLSLDWVKQFPLESASLVCIDGNIPIDIMTYICDICYKFNIPVWFEPTCIDKSIKPLLAGIQDNITYCSPNLLELCNMYNILVNESKPLPSVTTKEEKINIALTHSRVLLKHIPHLFVTLGQHGLLYMSRDTQEAFLYPPAPLDMLPITVVNVTGAGDNMVGAIMGAISRGQPMGVAIKMGLKAAYLSLMSSNAVSSDLNYDYITLNDDWSSIEPKMYQL